MKQKAESRKVKLVFMDVKVELEGADPDINGQALGLLSVLVADRLKFEELAKDMEPDEEEQIIGKKDKKLQFDSMFN